MKTETKLLYIHDCEKCLFLGIGTWDGVRFDLYYCPTDHDGGSVIARYGDEGEEYLSTGITRTIHYGDDHILNQAYDRVVELGL